MRADQNELLTRTGPGAPLGQLFRRYWLPALLASELGAGEGPPVRVKLLSERLIAWRDSQNRLGLVDEFCAHRGVSLWFGRNEENGLRCSYHGWKYDVTGQCVEIPSEPDNPKLCQRMKLKSYPLVERGRGRGAPQGFAGGLSTSPFGWGSAAGCWGPPGPRRSTSRRSPSTSGRSSRT